MSLNPRGGPLPKPSRPGRPSASYCDPAPSSVALRCLPTIIASFLFARLPPSTFLRVLSLFASAVFPYSSPNARISRRSFRTRIRALCCSSHPPFDDVLPPLPHSPQPPFPPPPTTPPWGLEFVLLPSFLPLPPSFLSTLQRFDLCEPQWVPNCAFPSCGSLPLFPNPLVCRLPPLWPTSVMCFSLAQVHAPTPGRTNFFSLALHDRCSLDRLPCTPSLKVVMRAAFCHISNVRVLSTVFDLPSPLLSIPGL